MADNAITFRCLSVIYPHLLLSPSHFHNSLFTFSREGFLPERFSESIGNNNHRRIIYRDDNIARLYCIHTKKLSCLKSRVEFDMNDNLHGFV